MLPHGLAPDKLNPPAPDARPAVRGRSFPIQLPVSPRRWRTASTPREAILPRRQIDHEWAPAVPYGVEFDLLLTVHDDPPTRATLVLRIAHASGRPIRLSRKTRIAIVRTTWRALAWMVLDVGVRFDANIVRPLLVGAVLNLRDAPRPAPAEGDPAP